MPYYTVFLSKHTTKLLSHLNLNIYTNQRQWDTRQYRLQY